MTTDTETPVNVADLDGEESNAPASEDRRIYIDPDNLHAEVARLYQEHPDFRQAASTVIGTRAKREADARIRELEARLEEMSLSQKRRQFESMDEDELATAIRQNPTVAAEYAEVMQKRAPDASQIRSTNAVNLAVEEALDDLRAIGAPESRIDQWKAYLRDQNTPIDRSSPAAFIRAVQKAVDLEVHTPAEQRYEKYGYGKPPAPKAEAEEEQASEPQPVAANPRLARGAPVRSQPDGGGKRQRFSTQVEASQLLLEGKITLAEMRWAKQNLPYS